MTTAAPPAPATLPAKQRALDTLRFAQSVTASLLKDFPEDKATFQPASTDNHVVWNLGHLASTYHWLAGLLDGQPSGTPEGYEALFGGKSRPVPDPKAYPSLAQVRRAYDEAVQRFERAYQATAAADLDKPAIGECYGFLTDRLDAAYKAAWHEGWHAGQISSIRRALNLARVIG